MDQSHNETKQQNSLGPSNMTPLPSASSILQPGLQPPALDNHSPAQAPGAALPPPPLALDHHASDLLSMPQAIPDSSFTMPQRLPCGSPHLSRGEIIEGRPRADSMISNVSMPQPGAPGAAGASSPSPSISSSGSSSALSAMMQQPAKCYRCMHLNKPAPGSELSYVISFLSVLEMAQCLRVSKQWRSLTDVAISCFSRTLELGQFWAILGAPDDFPPSSSSAAASTSSSSSAAPSAAAALSHGFSVSPLPSIPSSSSASALGLAPSPPLPAAAASSSSSSAAPAPVHTKCEEQIALLASRFEAADAVSFQYCHQLTDAVLLRILRALRYPHKVTSLNLYYCFRVTDASLMALPALLPNLTALNMGRCFGIHEAGLRALVSPPSPIRLSRLNLMGYVAPPLHPDSFAFASAAAAAASSPAAASSSCSQSFSSPVSVGGSGGCGGGIASSFPKSGEDLMEMLENETGFSFIQTLNVEECQIQEPIIVEFRKQMQYRHALPEVVAKLSAKVAPFCPCCCCATAAATREGYRREFVVLGPQSSRVPKPQKKTASIDD